MLGNSLVRMEGHVLIKDAVTQEVLVDKKNAIHLENMSEAIALTLTHNDYGHIDKMIFGNGASSVSGTGAITYFPPNVTGSEATLYNKTYEKIVDDKSPQNTDDERNYIELSHTNMNNYTDIIVHCFLDYDEPSGQEAFDDTPDIDGNYVFDEIGLLSFPETGTTNSRLLTHVIFSPVEKSLNRAIEIVYTVRIYMSQ